jgi:hypothetical protein
MMWTFSQADFRDKAAREQLLACADEFSMSKKSQAVLPWIYLASI